MSLAMSEKKSESEPTRCGLIVVDHQRWSASLWSFGERYHDEESLRRGSLRGRGTGLVRCPGWGVFHQVGPSGRRKSHPVPPAQRDGFERGQKELLGLTVRREPCRHRLHPD